MTIKEGFYRVELINTVWEVPNRYQDLMPVGTGAFGQVNTQCQYRDGVHTLVNVYHQVCSATDTERLSTEGVAVKVAIKKIARPFQSQIHAKRTYRELKMLKHMKHENVSTVFYVDLSVIYNPMEIHNLGFRSFNAKLNHKRGGF